MLITGSIIDLAVVFLAGLAVSLTPCVYPLVPVTAAAIAGANVSGTRRGAVVLSLIYVTGLALSYAGLALIAAMTGKMFGAMQNTTGFLFMTACFFLFFALAMADLVPLPALRIFSAVKPRTPWAVLGMGAVSGFAVGPCTAPVLGALLVYVASRQNVIYGTVLMVVFAYGVGTFLVVAGMFGGMLGALPRAGVWMVWIKRAAALVLLAVAGYYFMRAFQLI